MGDDTMRKLLLGLIPLAAMTSVTAPASAQILIYTGPGGAPVAVNRNYLSYYDDTWTFAMRPTRFIVIPVTDAHASAVEAPPPRARTEGGRVVRAPKVR
jgi:hypothetical protein